MTSLIKKIFGKVSKIEVVKPNSPCNLSSDYEVLIEKLISEIRKTGHHYDIKLSDFEAGKSIMAFKPEASLDILMACLPIYVHSHNIENENSWRKENTKQRALESVIRAMLKRKLPFEFEHISDLIVQLNNAKRLHTYHYPVSSAIRAIENYLLDHEVDERLILPLKKLAKSIENSGYGDAENRRLVERARLLLSDPNKSALPLSPGEAWSDNASKSIKALPIEEQQCWSDLLVHCKSANAAKPSAKWLKTASQLRQSINSEQFKNFCLDWFSLLDKPKTVELKAKHNWETDPNMLFDEINADIIKGLAWCCSLTEDAEIARQLTKVGMLVFKKIPGHGAKSARIGNAVIHALSSMPGKTGLYQLALLRIKVKYRQALTLMEKSLKSAAEREGLTVDELAEMGVPSLGLERVGYGEETVGEYVAQIEVNGFHQVDLTWRKTDGDVQKTVPAKVVASFAQELKELKGSVKDIKSMMSVQKDRLEQLFLKDMSWSYETWESRYLKHPIVGVFAQRLIWSLKTDKETELVIYRNDQLETVDGQCVNRPSPATQVCLWHPIYSSVEEIQTWRQRLVELEFTQPFKQAHREVYLLTDAERQTSTYSNRFASHIIKQHQFNALAATRGWRYTLQGCWDGGGDEIASIKIDQYNVQAEFWVNGIGEYGEDTSEAGIFMYVSTDQVRFYPLHRNVNELTEANVRQQNPLPLNEVPDIVLSEVFRDVDLYVGVCSIGNDPEWSDGGPEGRYRDYWHRFSFGELSASAETRKEILQNLIPKLIFGKQCRFIDRFLVVEGKRRIYKIHLGSGNILMEPNNQYLCIVSDSRKSKANDNIFLPFEGDKTLSMIISKAALLAADEKIKDQSINSQIDRH
ncbi:DUF4132 domain-containing protein [Reinekea sp. G2M2-21]|uniref:DUF4132 domain-containing protein n=1 Tax=Reinekea sp. G2M2-21 TaxID=2788942 RepID=UPI0018A8F529